MEAQKTTADQKVEKFGGEEGVDIKKEDLLQSTKEEMRVVRQENENLKETLERIMKEYKSLQVQYFDIVHQKEATKNSPNSLIHNRYNVDEPVSEPISLSLGTTSSGNKKEKDLKSFSKTIEEESKINQGLDLKLDWKYDLSNNKSSERTANIVNTRTDDSFDESKDEAKEAWSPNKTMKNSRSGDEDEDTIQPPVKRARVSVRARCDAPTMNDGCQWRKYGQKIAKGNPCPRAYYRCTVGPGCPVRRQVQRCADDTSILITTYEGTHNHPLPVSAMTMASTTAAAASMLMSGSIASASLPINNIQTNQLTAQTLNYHTPLSTHPTIPMKANLYASHNPSFYSSSSSSHPTITLDLTKPLSHNSTTQLDLAAASSRALPYNLGLVSQSYLPTSSITTTTSLPLSQSALTDTLAKAITSNPSFHSVLAAAIKSYVGSQGAKSQNVNKEEGERLCLGQGLKWGEHLGLGPTTVAQNNDAAIGTPRDFLSRASSS